MMVKQARILKPFACLSIMQFLKLLRIHKINSDLSLFFKIENQPLNSMYGHCTLLPSLVQNAFVSALYLIAMCCVMYRAAAALN